MNKFIFNETNNGGTKTVYTRLEEIILEKNFTEFFFAVSYAQPEELKKIISILIEKGMKGKIVVTTDSEVTHPESLRYLKKLQSDGIGISSKVYDSRLNSKHSNHGFHSKVFVFENNQDVSIVVGSANISNAALYKNVEVDYLIETKSKSQDHLQMIEFFNSIWSNDKNCLEITDNLIEAYELRRSSSFNEFDLNFSNTNYSLNVMQIEALTSLGVILKNGHKRAIQIAATGTGKTRFASNAILQLINHTKTEIINVLYLTVNTSVVSQAILEIKNTIRNSARNAKNISTSSVTALNEIKQLNTHADINIFVSTHLFARNLVNSNFAKNFFTFIVIDECHHLYENLESKHENIVSKITNYFEPEFLLGLTATPRRTNNDYDLVKKVFDKKIISNFDIERSINEKLITDFEYSFASDSSISLKNRKLNIKEFMDQFETNDELVLNLIKVLEDESVGLSKLRAIAFVNDNNGKNKALANRINKLSQNIKAEYILAETEEVDRNRIFESVRSDEPNSVNIVFSDKVLTEGVDIVEINTILIFRITESPVQFIQQIGRGLRLDSKNKHKKLKVIDFAATKDGDFKHIVEKLIDPSKTDIKTLGAGFIPKIVDGKLIIPGKFEIGISLDKYEEFKKYYNKNIRAMFYKTNEELIVELLRDNVDFFDYTYNKTSKTFDEDYINLTSFEKLGSTLTLPNLINSGLWYTKMFSILDKELTKEEKILIELLLKLVANSSDLQDVSNFSKFVLGKEVPLFNSARINDILINNKNGKALSDFINFSDLFESDNHIAEIAKILQNVIKHSNNSIIFDSTNMGKTFMNIMNDLSDYLIMRNANNNFEDLTLNRKLNKFVSNNEIIEMYGIDENQLKNRPIIKVDDSINVVQFPNEIFREIILIDNGARFKTKQIGKMERKNHSRLINDSFEIYVDVADKKSKIGNNFHIGSSRFVEQIINDEHEFEYIFEFLNPNLIETRSLIDILNNNA